MQQSTRDLYFPPPGQSIELQEQRASEDVGLHPEIIHQLNTFVRDHPEQLLPQRWALWRNGYLVHVEGDFNQKVEVASLRKTWHALSLGAAIKQGKIPSYHQKINVWQTELKGNHADATWRNVITQSAGFDYPYADFPAYQPGEMWTYSDWNLVHFCHAMAKVHGKQDFYDNYQDVLREAYFEAIGMEGWSTCIKFDPLSGMDDGVRMELSLEHLGRLGLLVLARGTWNGQELIPRWFVEELETKQTYGMQVNYDGIYDGKIEELKAQPDRFPESPYGYFTWVNTDGDYFPNADALWASGKGAGGNITLWNSTYGIVFVAAGLNMPPDTNSIPHIIEQNFVGPRLLYPDSI